MGAPDSLDARAGDAPEIGVGAGIREYEAEFDGELSISEKVRPHSFALAEIKRTGC